MPATWLASMCRDCLVNACKVGSDAKLLHHSKASAGADDMMECTALQPTTLEVPGQGKLRITLLPPPSGDTRGTPLAAVEQARCADVLLACLPVASQGAAAGKKAGVAAHLDEDARVALQVRTSQRSQCSFAWQFKVQLVCHILSLLLPV